MPKTQILIVDTDTKSMDSLTKFLAMNQYKVKDKVDDPTKALKLCYENKYDVAFIAKKLPGTDGYELCHEIIKELNKIYIVIIHDQVTDRDVLLAKNSGARCFITKPYSNGIVLSSMNKYEMYKQHNK